MSQSPLAIEKTLKNFSTSPNKFSENFRYIYQRERQFNTPLSRRMSVAKNAYYEFYLLQPVGQVEPIEKYRPMKRNSKQSNSQESFASLFQKATQKHAANKKHNSNGFDVLC